MRNVLVCGAGGFIGGHLVKRLLADGYRVRAADQKPLAEWHQLSGAAENLCLDLAEYQDCRRACESMDGVFQLAADMGGIGFITAEHIDCRKNVRITSYMLEAAYNAGVGKFLFSSSACIYNTDKQADPNVTALKESDAYPAKPEDGYGEEKLYSEKSCIDYWRSGKLKTFIPRFHNIYGTWGDWQGGREKAPAAICRKVAEASMSDDPAIEIWGDGSATRSFCWIGDCVEGLLRIINCGELAGAPVNLGSSELVSINQLVDIVEDIAGIKLNRTYNPRAPEGVRGRNSDNTFIKSVLGWEPTTPLRVGLERNYAWIKEQMLAKAR